MNNNSPMRKLLLSINHSFSGYLMLCTFQTFCLQIFDRTKKANSHMLGNEMEETK